MKYLILFLAAITCFAVDRDPKRTIKKMGAEEAQEALRSNSCKDYLSAIYSVLVSEHTDAQKKETVITFFKDRKKLEFMREQGFKSIQEFKLGFNLVAQNLKFPSAAFLEMLKDKLFNPVADEDYLGWELRIALEFVIKDMKNPSKELLANVTKLKDGEKVNYRVLGIVVRHCDDQSLKKTLERTRMDSAERQWRWFPDEMRNMRHRLLVFKYMVDSYLKFEYPYRLFKIMTRDEDRDLRLNLEPYKKVSKEDATEYLKQIDRILAIGGKLKALSDKDNRLTDSHLKDLSAIRQLMEEKVGKP